MKPVKILGLAIFAACVVTAVAGAATAAAEQVICKNSTVPCTSLYPNGTKISAQLATGTVATLTGTPEMTCKKSTMTGVIEDNTSPPPVGHGEFTSVTFSECHTGSGTACTVKAVNLSYTFTAETHGLLLTATAGKGNPGTIVECGSFINCTFTTAALTLDVKSGDPAHLTASNDTMEASGFLCPSSAKWDATYVVTVPRPFYVI